MTIIGSKNNKNTGLGCVYYNKQRDRWMYQFYETDLETGHKNKFRKS